MFMRLYTVFYYFLVFVFIILGRLALAVNCPSNLANIQSDSDGRCSITLINSASTTLVGMPPSQGSCAALKDLSFEMAMITGSGGSGTVSCQYLSTVFFYEQSSESFTKGTGPWKQQGVGAPVYTCSSKSASDCQFT